MTVHELIGLIAAAGILSVAAASGFVNPNSSEATPAEARRVEAAIPEQPEQLRSAGARAPSLPESAARRDFTLGNRSASDLCRAESAARGATFSGAFCPIRSR